ncbi:MAG: peptide chain release factor 1 [Gammaproteobacteria bacterium]
MQESIRQKLKTLEKRHQEIASLLADPEVMNNQDRFRELAKEYAASEELVEKYRQHEKILADTEAMQAMLNDNDVEMRKLAEEELTSLSKNKEILEAEVQTLLLPQDPNDKRNVFLEIRAGAGGDEAAIFAGDLFRMYSRFAENMGWRVEVLNSSEGEKGGFREIISRIIGKDVYSRLKFESGVHRVQRVPETEAQGRVHTSTCTVAVFPEVDAIESIAINPADLRIDTYRSSGAGGQHVNVTNSAVRITHLPTGVVVECQDERSQHQNRAKALAVVQAKILAAEQEKQRRTEEETRRSLVGTGDRSEKIRTYNFPQGRMTDHRVNLTLYHLSDIIDGNLMPVIEVLAREHQADLLARFAESAT